MSLISRGIRNNNPMNIRKGSQWLGLSPDSHFEQDFCVFSHIKYGLRAAMYLLTKYVFEYHCVTIYDIIYRWAPPSENSTDVYLDAVVKRWSCIVFPGTRISPDYKVCSKDDLYCLMVAMCYIESGYILSKTAFEVSFNGLLPKKYQKLWTKSNG